MASDAHVSVMPIASKFESICLPSTAAAAATSAMTDSMLNVMTAATPPNTMPELLTLIAQGLVYTDVHTLARVRASTDIIVLICDSVFFGVQCNVL